jgi:arylsulfatase A-like enzyme
MDARPRLALALAALAAILAAGALAHDRDARAQAPERPPNVLIIVTDDQRVSTLDVMEETERAFSHQGITFTSAYATTPLCCPSRASILSGLYAHNHRVIRNSASDPLDYSRSVPAVLEGMGYRTAMIGKLSNAWQAGEVPPYFDVVSMKWESARTAEDGLADESVSFIEEAEAADDEPWMVWLGTRAPHTPLLPDPEFEDEAVPAPITPGQIEKDISDKPAFVQRAVRRKPRTSAGGFDFRRYADQIDFERESRREMLAVDQMVGRIFDALARTGEDTETIAFFLSDNGYMAGEHGGLARKHMPYLESVQIPMLMRWPGQVPAGVDSGALVANIDVAPTIYEAVGADPGYEVDGRSLLSGEERTHLYTERLAGREWPRFEGVVTESLHYVRSFEGESFRPLAQELYRLDSDPFELRNVLAGKGRPPATMENLKRLAEAARSCAGAACP